jgi:hypothetical protein
MDSSSIMLLADLGKAAFSSGSMLINASMNIIQRTPNKAAQSLAVRSKLFVGDVAEAKLLLTDRLIQESLKARKSKDESGEAKASH